MQLNRKMNNIALLFYCCINGLFVAKYAGRVYGYSSLFFIAYLVVVLIGYIIVFRKSYKSYKDYLFVE